MHPRTGNTQTTLDGGASNYYEFLSGYELHHDIPGTRSPMRFGKDARSASFSGIPEGTINFALRTINTLDNKSKPTLITTTGVGKYSAKGQRYPYGVIVGGTIDVGSFVDLSGLYQFEDYVYTMKPGGNALTITNNSSTAALWQQDCSDLPVITFTPGDGNVFESSLYYILLDSSDSSDRLKLVKLYDDTTHGVQYWYDAGTGNATNRWGSNLTGTISKAAGSSYCFGSGTAFTTELEVGDLVAGGAGDNPVVLGRVVSIQSNTSLELDKAHETFSVSSASIRIPNIRIDTVNDVIIGSVHKDSGGFVHTPLNTINTSIKTVIESDDSALAYYWPSNSVNGDYITETVAGVHGEVIGTAPTVSTQSPVGNSLVNDDGMLLLSDSQADALESGGFSASYWFKSTSSSGSGNARLLTRDNNNHWAMYMGQNEAADGVQNLKLQATGTGATVVKTNAITLNQWHHAGIVYDGTNFKFFLDGEEIFNKTGYTPLTDNARPIVFGVNTEASPQTQNKFVGQFTEIKFFDDPISNAQMRNLYRLPGSTVAGTSDMPIQLGGENGSVLKVTSDGLSLGNTTFASAPFRVDMAGNLTATSGTFSGSITGATGTFAGELTAGSLTVDKLSGDFNEEYSTQFRAVQTGDHTLASTLGTYSTIQEFSIPAPGGVAKAVKISGTLSTKAFNGTGSTQSTEYSIHLEMKAKGTAATNLGTAAADAVAAGLSAETVYISGNKLKEFGSAGSVSAAADGSSGQGDVIGVYYDAPTNRTYIQYLDASLSFDSGDTVHYSAENFTSASGFVQIQSGFDDATDRHSIIALPNNDTFYDKTYLSASLPKTSTATEFRLRVRNRKVLPTNLNVTFPTGAFKLEHTV